MLINKFKGNNIYYDGTPFLASMDMNCDVLSTLPQQCVANPSCGWCGDKNSCIQGTDRGPLAPCLKSTYLFNKPSQFWNPINASQININTQGKLHITAHPDVERAKFTYN